MMKSLGKRYSTLKNSKRSGFTLIEIVVVIAIMAILALILVPNLTAWVQKGDETKIQANMKSVHTAAEMVRQTEGSLDEDRIKEFSNNQDVKVDEEATEENLEVDKYIVTNKGGQTVVKYKTQDGKVFTFPDVNNVNNGGTGGSGESEDPNYGNEYLATDDDFEWEERQWDGYEVAGQTSKGYYKYTGDKTIVKIPHVIKGHPMTSYYMMFVGTNVEKVISNNPNITNMRYMFRGSNATTLDLSSFNTSNITDMSYMFYESQATTLDLSSFDTKKVTNMEAMFYKSQAASLDLSSFDTSKATTMSYMFAESRATTIDLSSFDTSQVTTMGSMFHDSQATTLDLRSFNTSKVTDMGYMFAGSPAETFDLSNFNTSKVTDMSNMFRSSQATTLNLSSFDTSNVTNMRRMFVDSLATTGYAKTQADANKLNSSSSKPAGLTFIVKP